MKKWNAPEVAELNINKTANGYLDVDFEGPFGIVLGDKQNNEDSNDKTNQES